MMEDFHDGYTTLGWDGRRAPPKVTADACDVRDEELIRVARRIAEYLDGASLQANAGVVRELAQRFATAKGLTLKGATNAEMIIRARRVARAVTATSGVELQRLIDELADRMDLLLHRLDDWAPVIAAQGGFGKGD